MNHVSLPSVCDRAAAKTVHVDLCDALSSEPVSVDASEVTRLGEAVLQVLVSSAHSEGGISIISPSDVFTETVAMAGLKNLFHKGETQ